MGEDILIKEQANGLLRLTINRPSVRNALNNDLIAALTQAFPAVGSDSGVRAIVLSGVGDKAFCAGADLDPKSKTFGFDYAKPRTAYADLLRAVRAVTVPLIGRVNGHCMAGGMGLLAVCDMAVASADAKFGLPEVKVGLFPMQVAALLQTIVPPRKFTELCLTGEPVTAQEALELGLLNYVVPPADLDSKVDWLVQRVTEKSPTAIRRGKYALGAIAGMTFEQALAFMEGQIGLMQLTEDAKEGMAAFEQKRPPTWTGR